MKVLLVLREQRFELYACYSYPHSALAFDVSPRFRFREIFLPGHFVAIDSIFHRRAGKKYTTFIQFPFSKFCPSRRILYPFIAKVHRDRIIFECCHQWSLYGRLPSVAYKTTNCVLCFYIFNDFFLFTSSHFTRLSKISWLVFYTVNGYGYVFINIYFA